MTAARHHCDVCGAVDTTTVERRSPGRTTIRWWLCDAHADAVWLAVAAMVAAQIEIAR